MNLKVNLGKDSAGNDVILDLKGQHIYLTILVGVTGSGKSVLGNHIYRQLVEQNSPNELGFVLIDNTLFNFTGWQQQSPFLLSPVLLKAEQSIEMLEEIARLRGSDETAALRGIKATIIHIEEYDLLCSYPERFKKAITSILSSSRKSHTHIIYSTSRIGSSALPSWLLSHVDFKVIFRVASKESSQLVMGSDLATQFDQVGEKILIYKCNVNGGKRLIYCKPLVKQEVELANNFTPGVCY